MSGRLLGYARVSTEEQGTDPQRDERRAAGRTATLEEHASGADRSRPVLARLLRDIRPGDTLVVVRLFGHLKRSMGLRRLKLRGLRGAAEEFAMAAAAQNLGMHLRRFGPPRQSTHPSPHRSFSTASLFAGQPSASQRDPGRC